MRDKHRSAPKDGTVKEIIARIMRRGAYCDYPWEVHQLCQRLGLRRAQVYDALGALIREGRVERVHLGGQLPDSYVWRGE